MKKAGSVSRSENVILEIKISNITLLNIFQVMKQDKGKMGTGYFYNIYAGIQRGSIRCHYGPIWITVNFAHLFHSCNLKEALEVLAAILRSLLTPFFSLSSNIRNHRVLDFNWDLNWAFGALIMNKVIIVIIGELE